MNTPFHYRSAIVPPEPWLGARIDSGSLDLSKILEIPGW